MTSLLPCLGACLLAACQPAADRASPGFPLWQRAQEALRHGQADRAIDLYEQSLVADPHLTRNYLGLAAAYLGKGDDARACLHLTLYVAAHPEHVAVRTQYADLLCRLRRVAEARAELERCVADVQDDPALADEHLLHCHSRLMEIAEQAEDDYGEHLHRGIGLFLLGRQRAAEGPVGALRAEGLFCKAAAELTLARRAQPGAARPSWYLHEVWTQMGQSQPAGRCLYAAVRAAPFGDLTPAEQRGLYLARRCHDHDAARK